MKRIFAILLVAVLLFGTFSFVGCNNDTTDTHITKPTDTNPTVTNPTASTTTTTTAGGEDSVKTYTLGMGVSFGEFTKTQIDMTIATVVLDDNGVIVSCRLDEVRNEFDIDYDKNKVNITNLRTNMEMGDDYLMSELGFDKNGDGVVLEWYEQARIFENYVIGMTAENVKNIPLQTEADGYALGYIIAADEDLLEAGCTIQITSFMEAVYKACNDNQGMSFSTGKEFTLGLAAISVDNGSSIKEEGARVQLDTYFASSVVSDGVILATVNDAAQNKVLVDWSGNAVSSYSGSVSGVFKTKRELKEDYNMSKYGTVMDWNNDGVVLEWYQQSAAFSNHIVGLTANCVAELPIQYISSGYLISAEDDLLSAGCTIQIVEMIDVVLKSMTNAR